MDNWRFPVAVAVSTLLMAPPVASQSVVGDTLSSRLTSRETLIQSDHEGTLLHRTTVDISGTRWLWRSEGSVLLYEESPMAGGYIEEQRTIGSPVEDLVHTVGCQVGPVFLGPVALRGTYHRMLDPAAGGTEWSALTDRSTPRLDRSVDSSRWMGGGLSGPVPFTFFGAEITPGAVWISDDESQIAAAVLPVAWPSAVVECSLARGSFSEPADESWVYRAPPFRADRVIQLGSSLTVSPVVAGVPFSLGVEGWHQRVGYRPPRWSYQAVARMPGETVSMAARVSRADSGFRTLAGKRPRSSQFSGVSLRQGRRVRPLIWHVSWERRTRWEDDLSGATVDSYSGTVGLAWSRGVPRLLRIQTTVEHGGPFSLSYRMHLARGPLGLLAYGRHRVMHPSQGDLFTATARVSVRTVLGRHRRRCSTSAGWNVTEEERTRHQAVSLNASIPVGRAFRLELSAKAPLVSAPTAESTEWLLRVRNTGPNRRRER